MMSENQPLTEPADSSRFLNIFHEAVKLLKRAGTDKLLQWLQGTDYFTAPASTRYHESYSGGLLEHSTKVYQELAAINACATARYEDETIVICGLFHDLCKVGFYKLGFRNVKDDESGKWNRVPTYNVEDSFPYGHGEKSVFMIERHIRLKPSEAIAIRWHMGGFDSAVRGGDQSMSRAYSEYPLAAMLHIADMKATYLSPNRVEAGQISFT